MLTSASAPRPRVCLRVSQRQCVPLRLGINTTFLCNFVNEDKCFINIIYVLFHRLEYCFAVATFLSLAALASLAFYLSTLAYQFITHVLLLVGTTFDLRFGSSAPRRFSPHFSPRPFVTGTADGGRRDGEMEKGIRQKRKTSVRVNICSSEIRYLGVVRPPDPRAAPKLSEARA